MILAGDYIPKAKQVRLDLPFSGTILANLEGPVTGDARLTPSPKAGPNLNSQSLGTDQTNFIFNLANNHTMDFGMEGLRLTRKLLSEKHVPCMGAGETLEDARMPIVVEEAGKKIGIIGCCEHQFGCADETRPGCAGVGFWVFDVVRELRQRCDFVIVSCHLAFEHSPLPSPRTREFYKRLIDAGADVIHGHHSHVPQGLEAYGKGVIFYGLGNFVVDPAAWRGINHRWSVIANLDFSGDQVRWEIAVVVVSGEKNSIVVRSQSGEGAAYSERYLSAFNACLKDDFAYRALWQTVATVLYARYYGILLKTPRYAAEDVRLSRHNRLRYIRDGLRIVLGGILGRPLSSAAYLADGRALLNFSQCESHQDVITTALQVFNGGTDDVRVNEARAMLKEFGFC